MGQCRDEHRSLKVEAYLRKSEKSLSRVWSRGDSLSVSVFRRGVQVLSCVCHQCQHLQGLTTSLDRLEERRVFVSPERQTHHTLPLALPYTLSQPSQLTERLSYEVVKFCFCSSVPRLSVPCLAFHFQLSTCLEIISFLPLPRKVTSSCVCSQEECDVANF